jgi:hypothetical protein
MGKLIHGTAFETQVDDESLFHLDMALTMLGREGLSVRVHVLGDGQVASFPSDGIVLVYDHGSHLQVDEGLLGTVLDTARDTGKLTLPFLAVPFDR